MSLPRVPKMEQRAHKTQALEALTHLRPLLRARRNHKKYLQNGFFSGLLVALLHYDDVAAIQKAFASAEGQAAVADVQTFATGGADIFMFDTRPV